MQHSFPFHLQIRPDGTCGLSREGELWTKEFATVEEALEYARTLPASTGAKATIFDEQGQPSVILYL